jgi:hypothetical protein
MRTITLRTNVRAILALATLFSVCGVNPAIAGKEVFTRTKPHVNVGIVDGEPAVMWFHANAQVFDDGKATGTIQVRVVGGESFLYRVVQGEATVEQQIVVELILVLERVGEDGAPTGETDLAIVRPSSTSEPCRIYDILGTQISVEAETTIGFRGFRHEHTRPE